MNTSNMLAKKSVIRNLLSIYLNVLKTLCLQGQPSCYRTLQLSSVDIQGMPHTSTTSQSLVFSSQKPMVTYLITGVSLLPGFASSKTFQEPSMAIQILLPVRYANLLPARQDGSIILPASQHMIRHLPAGISYQLTDVYYLASFKPPITFFNI